jgi:transcriptional regulator with XRE-family HTH domain
MEDRLLKLLDTEQLTSAKFADAIGVQRSSVSHILSGRNKPSFDFLQKTLKVFPMLNADWLILGEGNMYEGDINPVSGSLFDQAPGVQGQDPSAITVPIADSGNIKHDLPPPEADISTGIDSNPEKSYPEAGKDTTYDQIHREESAADESPATKSSMETKTTSSLEGPRSKTISRVIVFYTDKTFDSYEKGD